MVVIFAPSTNDKDDTFLFSVFLITSRSVICSPNEFLVLFIITLWWSSFGFVTECTHMSHVNSL